jgi:hypothetical protein
MFAFETALLTELETSSPGRARRGQGSARGLRPVQWPLMFTSVPRKVSPPRWRRSV